MKSKEIPKENRVVLLFPGEKETLVTSGEIAARFRKKVKSDAFGRPAIVLDDAELAKKDNGVFSRMRDAYAALLNAQPSKSVLVPTSRLREVINAIEEPFVRLDLFTQGKADTDAQISHVVGPEKGQYQFSVRAENVVGALRFTELKVEQADKLPWEQLPMTCGDSAVMFGAAMAQRTAFHDPAYKAQVEKRVADEVAAKESARSEKRERFRKLLKKKVRQTKKNKAKGREEEDEAPKKKITKPTIIKRKVKRGKQN